MAGKLINQVQTRFVDGTEIIPAMRPTDVEGRAVTVGGIFTHSVTVQGRAPTAADDVGDGHFPGRHWIETDSGGTQVEAVWFCVTPAPTAAVWEDITSAASVTGLTNPLNDGLNGAGHLLYNAAFAGLSDRYYDLKADASNYISNGKATLTSVYNAYHYADLTSALEIVLPDPDSVGSNDALFGIISVRLGSGGSVTLSQDEDWLWEKANSIGEDPSIPSGEGSTFRIRYSWDPVVEAYCVSVAALTPTVTTQTVVTMVPGSVTMSSLSIANKDTHAHTHAWTSTTQDGTVYALIGCFLDGPAAPTPPGDVTAITDPSTGSGSDVQGWWYHYKPSQGDLNAGSKVFSFGKTNEQGQIVVIEVTGAHASDPVGDLEFDRSSSSVRQTIGPVNLNTPVDGCLIVSSLSRNVFGDAAQTADVDAANGFTNLVDYNINTPDMPVILVDLLEALVADSYSSPRYSTNASTSPGSSQLEAFVIVPNE